MEITKIEPQKNIERVNIYIDNKFAFGLNDEIRYKYGLKKGMKLDKNFIDSILMEEEKDKAFNQAIKFLSYRQRSEKEVFDHLSKKEYDENLILNVIDKCRELGYLNDKEFAINFAKDKKNINKHGERRISYELKIKGVSDEIINQVLNENPDDEYDRALKLAEKRISSYKNDDRNAKYRKLSGYLQRRGYSYSTISKVMREVLDG